MSSPTATRPLPETGKRPPAQQVSPMDRPSSGKTLVLVGAFLAIALMLAVPVRAWFAQRAELDGLRDDITTAQQRVQLLTAARDQWRDAQYIAAEARIRLNMVLPGEAGLIAIDNQRTAAVEPPAPTTWYGRLWASTSAVAGSTDPELVPGDGR